MAQIERAYANQSMPIYSPLEHMGGVRCLLTPQPLLQALRAPTYFHAQASSRRAAVPETLRAALQRSSGAAG